MVFFFFKQKTAYEMRISDWSSDVCSSDLADAPIPVSRHTGFHRHDAEALGAGRQQKAAEHQNDPQSQEGEEIADDDLAQQRRPEIGRASCREQVCQYV